MHLKFLWLDKPSKVTIFSSAVLVLISFITVTYAFTALHGQKDEISYVVLHSSVYFGADNIGDLWQIFILPFFGFLIFLLNLFISDRLWKISLFYSRLILMSTTFIEAFILLGCASLLKWNI